MAKAAGATLLRGGAYKPRTSPYAFQGLGEAGPADPRRRARGDRPAGRHRGGRRRTTSTWSSLRRHAAGRHPQHAELRAAAGGRPVRQAGHAQARHAGHHRGVADGGGVHRAARQPRHRAVRARHPDVRDGHPQHARRQRRAGGRTTSRTCRSSSTRRTPAAGATWSCRCPARRSRSAPTASSSTCTRTRSRRCATGRRRWSTTTCARSPPRSASCRRCSGAVRPRCRRPPLRDRLAGMKVSRSDVLGLRVRAQQLDRDGGGTVADTAVLDFGAQDTGPDGALWALAVRGLTEVDDQDLVWLWTLRGAPHAYRRPDWRRSRRPSPRGRTPMRPSASSTPASRSRPPASAPSRRSTRWPPRCAAS